MNKENSKLKNQRKDEVRVYGENACHAIFLKRPEDIIQCFFSKELNKSAPTFIKELCSYLAKKKKAYHMISRGEIEQMTKSTHHENICLLVKKKKEIDLETFLANEKNHGLLLFLDDVSNPHNIGAIVRTAAHFGAKGIILNSSDTSHTKSAIRVAEGGLEYVNLFSYPDVKKLILLMQKYKFQIVTTSSHSKNVLSKLKWQKKALIFFGKEDTGLDLNLMKLGECINIDGTNNVESLNVSVAASILMYDFYNKHIG